MEVWKDIKDFECEYQVSNFGRIKSVGRTIITSNGKRYYLPERILKLRESNCGYGNHKRFIINLCIDW